MEPKWTEQIRVSTGSSLEGPPDDGHSWRKYGQKDILGAKYPRWELEYITKVTPETESAPKPKVSPVHLKVDVPFSLIHMSHGAATIRALIIIIHMNIDTLNT